MPFLQVRRSPRAFDYCLPLCCGLTRRFLADGVTLATGRWVTTGLALPALAASGDVGRLRALAAAALAGELVALSGAAFQLRRLPGRDVRSADPHDLISFRRSLPFAANAAMAQFYNRLDIILVATLTSATQVAEYAPASRLQDALYLLPAHWRLWD